MDNKNTQDQNAEAKDELIEVKKLKFSDNEIQTSEEKVDTVQSKTKPPAPVVAVANAVVSGGSTDEVFLSKCVYKNMFARKSLTVHHVQRRLVELGYHVADSDKDGWYGDMTKLAVSQFQKDSGIEGDGTMNAATFSGLFTDDHNVTVVIS